MCLKRDNDYIKIAEYMEFANRAFHLLNGKVNKLNYAAAICTSKQDNDAFGKCIASGVIEFNLYNHINNLFGVNYKDNLTKDENIKNRIVNTIIHELLHLDQDFSYYDYIHNINDTYYKVECAVYDETNLFIIENNSMIKHNLGMTKLEPYDNPYNLYNHKYNKFYNSISYIYNRLDIICKIYSEDKIDLNRETITDIYITDDNSSRHLNIRNDNFYDINSFFNLIMFNQNKKVKVTWSGTNVYIRLQRSMYINPLLLRKDII